MSVGPAFVPHENHCGCRMGITPPVVGTDGAERLDGPAADNLAQPVGKLRGIDGLDGDPESPRSKRVRGRAKQLVDQLVIEPLDVLAQRSPDLPRISINC